MKNFMFIGMVMSMLLSAQAMAKTIYVPEGLTLNCTATSAVHSSAFQTGDIQVTSVNGENRFAQITGQIQGANRSIELNATIKPKVRSVIGGISYPGSNAAIEGCKTFIWFYLNQNATTKAYSARLELDNHCGQFSELDASYSCTSL